MLVCGIFGQSTNKPENLDVNGVHILGIYNIERGKMSCGLSWDGDIQYGIGIDKLYSDFIINREIKPTRIPIMIGHTRQPSWGFTVTEDNAHPFGFGTSNDGEGYEMIFCHNGTLKNHKELAEKYNIELTEKVMKVHTNCRYEVTRDKIDSEILGEILYKTKTFHVLSDYIGAAALAWTWIDEPNKLYLWSGASKITKGSLNPNETEERPMHVYCKDKNTMFFSSLKNSLVVLGADVRSNTQIDPNTVYIITDGDFENAEKHKVSRKNAGQSEETIWTNSSKNNNHYNGRVFDEYDGDYCDLPFSSKQKTNFTTTSKTQSKTTDFVYNVESDKPLKTLAEYEGKVYSKGLRFYKNNELITGIYLYIKTWGFFFAGKTQPEAVAYFESIKNTNFNTYRGEFGSFFKSSFIPFTDKDNEVQFHYFKTGVMLKSLLDYVHVLDFNTSEKGINSYLELQVLSHISKHPIINMDSSVRNPLVRLEDKPFTGSVSELGFEKVYTFNNGNLVKWSKRADLLEISKQVPPVITLPATTEKKVPEKDLFTEVVLDTITDEYIIEDNLDDDFISGYISEIFEKHSEDISETIIEFSEYKDHKLIKEALETLNLIDRSLAEFVEKPNKK
jgi:hypothetical protein